MTGTPEQRPFSTGIQSLWNQEPTHNINPAYLLLIFHDFGEYYLLGCNSCGVWLKSTNVSEEHITFIFWVEE
jgi:hypothetical protein